MGVDSDIISERDRAVYAAAGYGQRAPLGDRPALLVVDVTYGFTGDRPEPILESIKRFPASCGEEAWRAMEALVPLLAAARDAGIPTFYTKGPTYTPLKAGTLGGKNPRFLEGTLRDQEFAQTIPDLVAPGPSDTVIVKDKISAFFGTPLVTYLVELGIDTVLLTGCTTSGCVRATCVDAFSYNFRIAVVEECVFDRGQVSHKVNLFEMRQKYADVLSVDAAIDYIRGVRAETRTSRPG